MNVILRHYRDLGNAKDLTVDDIYYRRFYIGIPRSDAYKQGFRAVLELKLNDGPKIVSPYRDGTAEADAFLSGAEDGHMTADAVREAR